MLLLLLLLFFCFFLGGGGGGKFGSKEFAQKKEDVIYCEATQVCYIEDAGEVTHVILMLLVEQG